MATYYLNQAASSDGDGSAGSPWNNVRSAEAGATTSGDIVLITPEVSGSDALAWNTGSSWVDIAAGVTWRVDPNHAVSGITNRRILPYFVRNGSKGQVFVVGAGGTIEGVRVSLGGQANTDNDRYNLIQLEAGASAIGCVYWAHTGAWSDDPRYLYPEAYNQYINYARPRVYLANGDGCLVEDCHNRLSGWQDFLSADGNIKGCTIRFCDFRGTYKSQTAFAIGSAPGPSTPLRGNLLELNNFGPSTEEDNLQTFGPTSTEDPADDMPRSHGLVLQYNILGGFTGENAYDPKFGQCHLVQYNIAHSHPGNDDGPFEGPEPREWIGFPSMSGASNNYTSRYVIVRNNCIVWNAKGNELSRRAVYNNIIVHNMYRGPEGDWGTQPNRVAHEHSGAYHNAWQIYTIVNNIVGQHTRVDPTKDDSFEVGMIRDTANTRINYNAYFNTTNLQGEPVFVAGDTRSTITLSEFQANLTNSYGRNLDLGGEVDSLNVNSALPIFENMGGDEHLITSSTDALPNDFDTVDWGLRDTAPAALLTGGGGQCAATVNSGGTLVTVDREWVFYSPDRWGNPGSTNGSRQGGTIPGDNVMNMRTGEIRQIVSMPTTIADIGNGQFTVDSAISVQVGDEFAFVPAGWATNTVPRGLTDWSGAGINADQGQGGQFQGSTPPPPDPDPDDNVLYCSDDFAGAGGTDILNSPLENDVAGDGWSRSASAMTLTGNGEVELVDYLSVDPEPVAWLATGINDPQVRLTISPNGGTEAAAFLLKTDAIIRGEPWNGYRINVRYSANQVRITRHSNGVSTVVQNFGTTFTGGFEDFVVYWSNVTNSISVRQGTVGQPFADMTVLGTWADPSPFTLPTTVGFGRSGTGSPNPLVANFEVRSTSDTPPSLAAKPDAPTNVVWAWTDATSGTLSWSPVAEAAFYIISIDGVRETVQYSGTSIVLTGLDDNNDYAFAVAASTDSGRASDFSAPPVDITYSIAGGETGITYSITGGNVSQTHAILGGERAFLFSPYGSTVTQDDSATGDPLVKTAIVWNKLGDRPTNGVETSRPFWAFDLFQDTPIRVTTPGWSYAQIRITDGLGLYGAWQMWTPDTDIPASNYVDKGLFSNAQRVFIECRATP